MTSQDFANCKKNCLITTIFYLLLKDPKVCSVQKIVFKIFKVLRYQWSCNICYALFGSLGYQQNILVKRHSSLVKTINAQNWGSLMIFLNEHQQIDLDTFSAFICYFAMCFIDVVTSFLRAFFLNEIRVFSSSVFQGKCFHFTLTPAQECK